MTCYRFIAVALLLGFMLSTNAEEEFGASTLIVPDNTNWLSYNHNINGQRYVPLNQINRENAAQLGQVCSLQIDKLGSFQTSILHIDGLLYFTTATDTIAVDSASCEVKWRNHHDEEELEMTTLRVNRGLAYSNGRLYRGTIDSRLLAIDALTGETIWENQVGDPQIGEFFSASPQIYQSLVIIGTAGSDWGIKGRMMAYDAATGREVWRFHTIPSGDEVGAGSWVNAGSARIGGGGTWTTYTLDISAGELFVPVGNPSPDLLPDKRPGENLFTNSLVVLNANTGELKWYHQLLSNDGQDLDLGAAPVLYYNSNGERMVGFGSKDGYLYAINRETKKRVFRTPVTTIKNAGVVPTVEGIEVCPGPLGGVEWNGPAYDKKNKTLIVGSVDWCALLTAQKEEYQYQPGQFSFGGTFEFIGEGKGRINAVDADTGKVRWALETKGPVVAGITPTDSGVVYAGDLAGNFMALDGSNGKTLYQSKVSGGLAGGMISYMRDAKQYVAFVTGNVSRVTFGDAGSPTINIFALNGKQTATKSTPVAAAAAGKPNARNGQITYGQVCASCHGSQGEGGIGLSLKGIAERMEPAKIVEWIKNPSAKMPRLFPSMLDEQSVIDVVEYVKRF